MQQPSGGLTMQAGSHNASYASSAAFGATAQQQPMQLQPMQQQQQQQQQTPLPQQSNLGFQGQQQAYVPAQQPAAPNGVQQLMPAPLPGDPSGGPQQHTTYTLTATTSPTGFPTQHPPPKRGFFSIFKRRSEMAPLPGKPPGLPQQGAQLAFQPAPGRPLNPEELLPQQQQQLAMTEALGVPPGHRPMSEPPLPRDAQPLQALVGGNWLFLEFAAYFVAVALQDTHLQLGLIIATGVAGLVLVLGLLVWVMNWRKVFPHILELLMPVIFGVQLGVSYHSESYKREVIRTFNFTTHSALAGTCLLSMLVCYPVGYQTAQELVHRLHMRLPEVHRCGLVTTAVLTASLVTSNLLYLAPLCKGYDDRHWNALNLIFRIIYPCVATFLALLAVRFLPDVYLPNLAVVHGLNRKPPARLPAYLAHAVAQRPPAILDATMYQSTMDAATKQREAATMRRAAPPHPSKYAGGGPGGPQLTAGQPVNGPPPDGGFHPLVPEGSVGAGMAGFGVSGGPGHSLYTYYAAGPPSPPPLAVYAVYGDYDTPPPPPPPRPLGAHPADFPAPITNPLAAAPPRGGGVVQPLLYGGFSRAMPAYGPYPQPYQYGGGDGYKNADGGGVPYDPRRRMYGGGYGYPQAPMPYNDGQPLPGRNYASVGGAGPYGVNVPYSALAAGGDPWGPAAPGVLPPHRHLDAIVANPYVGPLPGYGDGGFVVPGDLQTRRPLAGSVQAQAAPYGTKTYSYVGSVALTPGGQAHSGRQRYGTDGGAGYGLGPELRQPPVAVRQQPTQHPPSAQQSSVYGRAPAPSQPPPRSQYGLDVEFSGPPRVMPQGPAGPIDGSLGQSGTPSRTPRSGYGLEAETRVGSPTGTGMPPPPTNGSAETGFGLAAEVGGGPRTASSYGTGPAPVPRRLPPPESFGLDAEVDGA